MFFLGLWWENTNRQGALAGMTVGLTLWVAAVVNTVLPLQRRARRSRWRRRRTRPDYAQYVPPIGAALIGTPLVFIVTIAVSLATHEPQRIKKMVRQCHSPEPMGQQQSAEVSETARVADPRGRLAHVRQYPRSDRRQRNRRKRGRSGDRHRLEIRRNGPRTDVVDVDATSYSLGTEQVDRIRQGNRRR